MPKIEKVEFGFFSPKFDPLVKLGRFRYKVFYGGRGGGKSHAVAEAAIFLMHTYQTRIVCLREIQKSLKESSYQLFVDKINQFGLANDFVCIDGEIRCKRTGSHVIFKGFYPDPTRLKGLEAYDVAIVEEAENVSERSWKFLTPTIRATFSEIWIVFNPRFTSDPTWSFVSAPREDSYIAKINYDENPLISPALIKEAEYDAKHDPSLYRWIWLGEPMDQGSNILIPDNLVASAILREPVELDAPIVAGLDVARSGDDWSALVIRKGNRILAMERWKTPDLMELVERVGSYHTNVSFDYLFVDSVGVGAGVYDGLKRVADGAFELRLFNGAHSPRKPNVYANMRAECWFLMRDWIRDLGQLPNDRNLRLELSSLQYKHDKQNRWLMEAKEDLKKRGGKSPDLSDALSMTFAPLVIAERPKLEQSKPKRKVGFYG
jgi:phage terminase large subunit